MPQDNEVLRHAFAIPNPDRSPLYDVRNPARASCEGRNVRSDVFADDDLVGASFSILDSIWWSQTGSNRRPHACKARALPAELWPRMLEAVSPSSPIASKTRVNALSGLRRARFALGSCVAAPRVARRAKRGG